MASISPSDDENDVSTLSTLYYTSGHGVIDRVRGVTFQILNAMLENRRVTDGVVLGSVLLVVVDWLQVLSVLLTPTFAWDEDLVSWRKAISIEEYILSSETFAAFNTGFGLAIGLCWLYFLSVSFAGWSQVKNQYQQTWCVKSLRFLSNILATAGFVPIIRVLVIPMRCSTMTKFLEDGCDDWRWILYLIASIITLVLFVPLVLLVQLTYFDDSPLSKLPTAKSLGRVEFYDTLGRTVIVIAAVVFQNRSSLLNVIALAVTVGLAVFTNMTLPFYKMRMNQLKSSMYSVLAWVAFGAILGGNISMSDDTLRHSAFGWIGAAVLLFIGCFFAPWIRYNWLLKLSNLIGKQQVYENDMRNLGIDAGTVAHLSPHDLYETRRKSVHHEANHISTGTLQNLFASPSKSKLHAIKDDSEESDHYDSDVDEVDERNNLLETEEESKVANARPRNRRASVSEKYQPGKLPLAEIVKKYYLFESDIELMVRTLLQDPIKDNFVQAANIMNAALKLYPDSVFIRLVYVTVILTYSSNSMRVVSLLQEAQQLPVSFDLKFRLFCKIYSWNSARQSQAVGTRSGDMMSVMYFKKQYKEAAEQHREAIKQISRFWTALYSTKVQETVAVTVQRIAKARDKAEDAYIGLLERYPSNVAILRSYGLFCLYVKNEHDIAEMYLKKVMNLTAPEAGNEERTYGGDSSSFGGGRSSMGSSTLAETRKKGSNRVFTAHHPEYHALRKMKIGFATCAAILVALTIGMFVGSTQLLDRNFETLPTIEEAGARRTSTNDIWFFARRMHLAALEGNDDELREFRQQVLDAAEELHTNHQTAYFSGVRSGDIDRLWDSQIIEVGFFDPSKPDSQRLEMFNLWDLGNFFVSTATNFANLGVEDLKNVETVRSWRFLADNTFAVVLEAFEDAADLYDEFNQAIAEDSNILQGAILSAKAVVTAVLAFFVFRYAIHNVYQSKRRLQEIVERIPDRAVRFLHKRFRAISKIYSSMEGADETTTQNLEGKLQDPRLKDISKIWSVGKGKWSTNQHAPVEGLVGAVKTGENVDSQKATQKLDAQESGQSEEEDEEESKFDQMKSNQKFQGLNLNTMRKTSKFKTLNQDMNLGKLLVQSKCNEDEKHIRRLCIRLITTTVLLCILYSLNFFVTYEVMREASFTGSEVNNAERRISLSSEIVNLSGELLIGDGEVFESVNETNDRLKKRINRLRQVHDGTRFGDDELNLPGTDRQGGTLDEILYFHSPGSFDVSGDAYGETLFAQGVEVSLRYLIRKAETIRGEFGDVNVVGEFNDTNSTRPGRDANKIRENKDFSFMMEVDREHLRPGLQEAGNEFVALGFETLDELEIYEVLLFVADLILYILLYLGVYRTMAKDLIEEGKRSEDLLLLIPEEVVERNQGLQIFFRGEGRRN